MSITTPSSRVARIAAWAAAPAAPIASGIVVSQASYSAFSSTTSNPTSNWATGSVNLTDNDSDGVLFNASNVKPGSTDTRCIAVTSHGSLPSAVKLYASNVSSTNALGNYIDLTITQGTSTSSSFGDCGTFTPATSNATVYSGTLSGLSTSSSYASGLGSWAPTGASAETRVYKFTYSIDAAAPNTTQNSSATAGFTWEAQNS